MCNLFHKAIKFSICHDIIGCIIIFTKSIYICTVAISMRIAGWKHACVQNTSRRIYRS